MKKLILLFFIFIPFVSLCNCAYIDFYFKWTGCLDRGRYWPVHDYYADFNSYNNNKYGGCFVITTKNNSEYGYSCSKWEQQRLIKWIERLGWPFSDCFISSEFNDNDKTTSTYINKKQVNKIECMW